MQHRHQRFAYRRRKVPQSRVKRLHHLLQSALLQLGSNRLAKRIGRVIEALEYCLPYARPPQAQQDPHRGSRQFSVGQQRQRWKQDSKALDLVGTGLSSEEGIDNRHFHRAPAYRDNGLVPPLRPDPVIPLHIEGLQPS
jgi:hypothetical protein